MEHGTGEEGTPTQKGESWRTGTSLSLTPEKKKLAGSMGVDDILAEEGNWGISQLKKGRKIGKGPHQALLGLGGSDDMGECEAAEAYGKEEK